MRDIVLGMSDGLTVPFALTAGLIGAAISTHIVVVAGLAEIAAETGTITEVHNVRVRETDEGEIVNLHCRVDPALTVQAVHDKVDEIERALRRRAPSIKRVIGHAEPQRA